ncbi:MAG TPA: hypothetical protein VJH70_03230 [Candidatus Paceibacterota bacterium]
MEKEKYMVIRDMGIVVISILMAITLIRTGIIHDLLGSSRQLHIWGSLIAGMMFTSVFTTAPATATLGELAQSNSVLLVAFFGALGGLLGDLIIFRFVRDSIKEDIVYLLKKARQERLLAIFRLRIFRWLVPFLGAIIVASPLPDEIGLAMMGVSKLSTARFIPISFLLNFIGIFVIGLIAQSFA